MVAYFRGIEPTSAKRNKYIREMRTVSAESLVDCQCFLLQFLRFVIDPTITGGRACTAEIISGLCYPSSKGSPYHCVCSLHFSPLYIRKQVSGEAIEL